MRDGPKTLADPSPLPWAPKKGLPASKLFAAFCGKFLLVPKGHGVGSPFLPRPWQVDLVGSVIDADPQPRVAGWCLPRGSGKTTLLAALAVHELFNGPEATAVAMIANDLRQAELCFRQASRMVETSPALAARCGVYRDRLEIPRTGANMMVYPSSPKHLEGLDFNLAVVDEIGEVSQDTWETVISASGKQPRSTVIGIGTPSARMESVLTDLRAYHLGHKSDETLVWREHSAAGFEKHPVDCEHCWELANPALDDFIAVDGMKALLPPKTREATFRRYRLCQIPTQVDDAFLPDGLWANLSTGKMIPPGSEVIVALDGSYSEDLTVLLIGTVSQRPHFAILGVWDPADSPDGVIPVADVEKAIVDATNVFRVAEITADPYRWTRSLQVLEALKLPVTAFHQSPARLTAATSDLYSACVAHKLTHSGEEMLARHVASARVIESDRGMRLAKAGNRKRNPDAPKIDLVAALVMCHSRAVWKAANRKKNRVKGFKR